MPKWWNLESKLNDLSKYNWLPVICISEQAYLIGVIGIVTQVMTKILKSTYTRTPLKQDLDYIYMVSYHHFISLPYQGSLINTINSIYIW